MRSVHLPAAAAAGIGLAFLFASTSHARVAPPPPLLAQAAVADAIVLARVTSVEDKDLEIPSVGQTYRVARVMVLENLYGAKDVKELRVAFVPPSGKVPRGTFPADLRGGQEYVLAVRNNPSQKVYVLAGAPATLSKSDNPGFMKEYETLKKHLANVADPKVGLNSKDGAERTLTAAMLIMKYRTPSPWSESAASEPIDAEESKLILRALRDADWKGYMQELRANPYTLFVSLGLGAGDGWAPKGNVQEAAREWLGKNADTYRIRRIVPGK
jgi:hypothetical protein